ncbi:MAG: threonylcarbamoyl-AMP synthase [Proteobacteria bacterium]|nr:threonylcarbamoyl-AMP synthase [Pseudomonadota bacterium]
MSERLTVHPINPQPRSIARATSLLREGGLGLCPTDAGYTLVWMLDARDAEDRVRRLRALDSKHPFTLLCASLSDVGRMARLGDAAFRLMKSLTPGPCTFILTASSDLPRRLKLDKRHSIGVRRIDHPVAQTLLQAVEQPLLSTSVVLPDVDDLASHMADDVAGALLDRVDFMLDAGDCEPGPTSVVDVTGDVPQVLRQGHRPLDL